MNAQNEHTMNLIVDVQQETRNMLSDSLRVAGYDTVTAERGTDALRLAADLQPALILLGIVLPGMDGFEVCRRLKVNPATQPIPVIFISALSDDVNNIQGLEAGGVDYLTKPFHVAELVARVNTHLLLRQSQQQLQEQHLLLAKPKLHVRALAETTLAQAEDMTAAPGHYDQNNTPIN